MKKKKMYEYIGLIILIISSFYFTNEARIYILNKNPLVKVIRNKENNYNIDPVNAIIKDNTIIPGLYGKKVDVVKSFNRMKEFGTFNETFLIFSTIMPKISIKNNKNLLIIGGNSNKRAVSILLEYNSETIKNYGNSNINLVINELNEYNPNYENINNIINSTNYEKMEKILEKNNLNNELCLDTNDHNCKNKRLIKPSLILTNTNYNNVKDNIVNGSIILVKKSVNTTTIDLLINHLNYKDIRVLKLSQLISETL